MVKVRGDGGSVVYVCLNYVLLIFILFGSWGKILTGTLSCLLLQLQYLFILFYFVFLSLTYSIF